MKFNFKQLPQLFKSLTKSGMADDVAKFAANNADEVMDVVDDIPTVRYLNPRNVGLSDDILSDTTTRLGKFNDVPTFGVRNTNFHELSPDLDATVQVPELALDDLVFAQHDSNPSVVSVRPHQNTALGRWFQKQTQNLGDTPDTTSITPDAFVQNYKNKRLEDVSKRNLLYDYVPSYLDDDLPF